MIGLAGCSGDGGDGDGGSDGGSNGSTEGGSDGGDGGSGDAVSFWNLHVQGAPKEAGADIVSTFEEDTGITVEQTKYENTPYKSAITNALGTSNAPDVFYVWTGPNRLGRYVENGSVMPLDDHFSDDELSAFVPDAIRGARYEQGDILSWRSEDGSLFAMPHNLSGIVIWYNKKVLQDAGVDPSTLQHSTDTTWQEFLDVCQTVKDAGYTPIQCGNRNRWTIGHWMSAFMIKSAGVDGYLDAAFGLNDRSLDDDAIVEGISRLSTLYDEEYFNRDINSLNNNEAASLFFNDQAAFWHQGTWAQEQISAQAPEGFGGIPDHMDYMWFPYFPELYENGNNERVSVVPNASYAVSARTEQRGEQHLENAIEFLKYWNSKEAQTTWFEQTGQLVTRPSVYDDIELDAAQETITSTLDAIDAADAVATVFDVAFLPETSETLLSGSQQLFTDRSAQSLLEDAQETNEEALSEFQ
ncbi:ABC transporter substrate-binding protein [Halomicrobium urmianum]|uniref:ABC transporter substrate-binding protein n=1 Tax=Halomicrobium urmianum TaxID=1586233 RepID=UPI001CD9BC86|nr:extracellular solute-binding protein [Halomicrobium urmianum]